jgi:hypothetical protein
VQSLLRTHRHFFTDPLNGFLTVYWLTEPDVQTGSRFPEIATEFATLCLGAPKPTAALLDAIITERRRPLTTKKTDRVLDAAGRIKSNKSIAEIARMAGVSKDAAQSILGRERTDQEEIAAVWGWKVIEQPDGSSTIGNPPESHFPTNRQNYCRENR